MKTGEKRRIKGTSENVRIVKINGDNVTVRLKNGTLKAVNICNLRMPVKKSLQWMIPFVDNLSTWAKIRGVFQFTEESLQRFFCSRLLMAVMLAACGALLAFILLRWAL